MAEKSYEIAFTVLMPALCGLVWHRLEGMKLVTFPHIVRKIFP